MLYLKSNRTPHQLLFSEFYYLYHVIKCHWHLILIILDTIIILNLFLVSALHRGVDVCPD